jgi:DNA-binding Lrp family transcriptional regulator
MSDTSLHGAIDEIDKKLMMHLTNFPEASLAELARAVGMTKSGVRKRMLRPIFKKFLVQLRERTEDVIVRGQRAAALKLIKLCSSANERIALEAAKVLLNPLLNKSTTEHKFSKELIFRSQIGSQGQLQQEVIDIQAGEDAAVKPQLPQAGDRPGVQNMPAVAEAFAMGDGEEEEDEDLDLAFDDEPN